MKWAEPSQGSDWLSNNDIERALHISRWRYTWVSLGSFDFTV
jgi:hypothetical protein